MTQLKLNILKLHKTLFYLAITAALLKLVGCMSYFITCDFGNYRYVFSFPSYRADIFAFLFGIAPYILLLLYLVKFHKDSFAEIFLPITLATAAISSCIDGLKISKPLNIVIIIITLAAYSLVTLSALKGFKNKSFVLYPLGLMLLFCLISMIMIIIALNKLEYLTFEQNIPVISSIATKLSLGTLTSTLLVLGIKDSVSGLLNQVPKKDAKSSLLELESDLTSGKITKEQYTEKRMEILRNL